MPLSVKTKEHMRRRLTVALPKWGALAAGAAALALSIAFTHQALHFVVVSDTHGGSTRILTASTNVDTLLRQSDILSLHLPLTPQTQQLLNRQRLAVMKPSAILINTARGGLVDSAALAQQLR